MPIHRSLSRANFPLMTLLLILANCFVFLFLQSGDARVSARALEYYAQAHLVDVEFPAYLEWLRDHDNDAKKMQQARSLPADVRVHLIESDAAFVTALDQDRVILPTHKDYADWHDKRIEFERIRDSAFTTQHVLRYSKFEPARIICSMFMHGGVGHLIGNMIFLGMLGLLVEGALGAGWFLALYLTGGIGAAFASLAWHWGDHGALLGASGAIAALMGAYCVIWGLRKVRVFYWFFIVFDYVRVPALTLLPIWFGWQLFSMWLDRGANVAFDAHAGGILSGAALAFLLRRYGRVRDDFVEEDERVERRAENVVAFDQALQWLGRLELGKAREILERIDREEPGQLRVLIALYRCARYGSSPDRLDLATTRVLGFAAKNDADIRELKIICDDYLKFRDGTQRLAADTLMRLVTLWLRIGEDAAAETLLRTVAEQIPKLPTLPAAWFALALHAPEGSAQRRARLQHVVQHHAQSRFAAKAEFLLQQG